MDWNAEWYENKHGFVAEYGRELLSCVLEIQNSPFWTWAAEPVR